MEKQTIHSISNKEKYICYTLSKKSSYFYFLSDLLKEFDILVPDFYDGQTGKIENAEEITDAVGSYENSNIEIMNVFGAKRVFLIVRTKQRDKLIKFMEEHCEFLIAKK